MVFQDNFLYSGIINDNIMIGNLDAIIEESMPAIKSVLLEEMIKKLPEGLETELGDRSLILFGGLKQHVAIVIGMSAMV